MSDRGALRIALALGLAGAACGHPEKKVVDQYFLATNANDTQTLSSFAAVKFEKKVDRWSIASVGAESRVPAPLPDLAQKAKDIDAEMAENKKAASAYRNDHFAEVDQVRSTKDGKIPPKLQSVKADWDKFEQKDKELKKALAEAKDALEKERRNVALSVGDVNDVETLKGEMLSKDVELDLTIQGQSTPYVMTLRKYELEPAGQGQRLISRWVVFGLQSKG